MRITVAIVAMGGEGGGVLADWIVDLAEQNGYLAQATSVPGVAQRTGSTIYYLEMFPAAAARKAAKDPVFALMPVPGQVDIVIASELMEAGRALERGLVTPDRTTLIASTNRVYSMIEKTALADGRVDSTAIVNQCAAAAKKFVPHDFAAIAEENRSVISAALFGALASTGALPFQQDQFEAAIRRGGVGVESSLAAFRAAQNHHAPAEPQAAVNILDLAKQRLTEYQDARYADEFLRLLEPIRTADPKGTLFTETARNLALWMTYEDAIRVADLKIRRTRFDRVRRETRATGQQIVKIHDYLYPRVNEIADILPAPIGKWLLRSSAARKLVERLTSHGRIVETTSITGYLRLRALTILRRWRRGSLRFEREHQKIREWLSLIADIGAENYDLAVEAARCPTLRKGYGETYQRGAQNFDRIIEALPKLRQKSDAAAQLRKLREAALANETSDKLIEALKQL